MCYSNKDYKKLGDRIRSNPKQISDEDLLMLQTLRVSYKEPLAVIFNSIEKAAYKVDENCICTYRVKRIESIINFLTFNNTIMRVLVYLSDAVTNSYRQNKVSSFCQYYQCFLNMIAFWIEEQRFEISSFSNDNIARNSRLLRTEWTNSINNGINALNYIMWKMNKSLSFGPLHIVPYYRMRQIRKQFERRLSASS